MNTHRVAGAGGLLLGLAYLYFTAQIPAEGVTDAVGARSYPYIIGSILIVAAGALLFSRGDASTATEESSDAGKGEGLLQRFGLAAAVLLVTAIYIALLEPLGFVLSTTLYTLGLMSYFHRGHWFANVASSAGFSVISYIALVKLLGASLPAGLLAF